jgi:6-pyruvoyl-tetrahydropterin synthase
MISILKIVFIFSGWYISAMEQENSDNTEDDWKFLMNKLKEDMVSISTKSVWAHNVRNYFVNNMDVNQLNP